MFAILQKYDFSSKSQLLVLSVLLMSVVCDTAKVRFFKQITTELQTLVLLVVLFAILQKYDVSSKSQRRVGLAQSPASCLRYCKSTIFQANHNEYRDDAGGLVVVCDTAKVRFFKQITTHAKTIQKGEKLFAILQKYDFSSKSQRYSVSKI